MHLIFSPTLYELRLMKSFNSENRLKRCAFERLAAVVKMFIFLPSERGRGIGPTIGASRRTKEPLCLFSTLSASIQNKVERFFEDDTGVAAILDKRPFISSTIGLFV